MSRDGMTPSELSVGPIREIRDQFEASWRSGEEPRIEGFLDRSGEGDRHGAVAGTVDTELRLLGESGSVPTLRDYQSRFPEWSDTLASIFEEIILQRAAARSRSSPRTIPGPRADAPTITKPATDGGAAGRGSVGDGERGRRAAAGRVPRTPEQIGRYQILRELGRAGSVAFIWHGPGPEATRGPEDADPTIGDGRRIRRLPGRSPRRGEPGPPRHRPRLRLGRTPDGLCYVVSKFIDGPDLAAKVKRPGCRTGGRRARGRGRRGPAPPTPRGWSTATSSRNILLDARAGRRGRLRAGAEGRGLRQGPAIAGTPGLHEPRAGPGRGPPGRWPLGHLQPGRRLLRAAHRASAVPGRPAGSTERDESGRHRRGPAAPADRRHDPEGAGADLPEGAGEAGVRAVQHGPGHGRRPAPLPGHRGRRPVNGASPRAGDLSAGSSEDRLRSTCREVVPKGLRSFDAHDADFFLELLPGPRDRDGLPESLRFWKTRIEETDAD